MKEKNVQISVIIPVYNAELYLEKCIESVLGQTFDALEVICVDDGSSDASVEILRKFQNKDERLIVLQQKNRGAGAARNNGLRRAKGKFIHFLDADDWVDTAAYEKLYKVMTESRADVGVFMYTRYDNRTGAERKVRLFELEEGKTEITTFSRKYWHFCNTSVVPWNKIYNAEFLRSVGARFDEIVCANDRAFYFQTITAAKSIVLYAESLIFYRENNELSLVGQGRSKHFDCHLTANDRIFQIAKSFPDEIFQRVFNANMEDLFSFFWKSSKESKKENFRGICDMLVREMYPFDLESFRGKSWYANGKIALLHRKLDTNKIVVPVVFATNNGYAPFLDVAILSLIAHATPRYYYDIYVFETELSDLNIQKLEEHKGENYRVNCIDLKSKFNDSTLYSRAHYSKEMYYRIFIPELFYHCDKVVYLDCDVIVNRDIAQLYEIDLGDAPLGAVHNAMNYSMYRYVTRMLKLPAERYFNSGVLLINVNSFVENKIKIKCFDLLKIKNNLVCPDQDLLNLSCRDSAKMLDSGWNFQWHNVLPYAEKVVKESQASLDNAQAKKYITHFTSGKKAWSYPENEFSIDFWNYAESSRYNGIIRQIGMSKRIHTTVYEALQNHNDRLKTADEALRRLWALESSFSYKLGRFLTWIPRKTAAFFRCWHTKGFKYTMVRVFRGKKRAQEYLARREND